jgi:hypothetical protein
VPQDGEAGGITQQIGATNVPIAVIKEQCKMVPEFEQNPLKLPGLLIIDTPGHESFRHIHPPPVVCTPFLLFSISLQSKFYSGKKFCSSLAFISCAWTPPLRELFSCRLKKNYLLCIFPGIAFLFVCFNIFPVF